VFFFEGLNNPPARATCGPGEGVEEMKRRNYKTDLVEFLLSKDEVKTALCDYIQSQRGGFAPKDKFKGASVISEMDYCTMVTFEYPASEKDIKNSLEVIPTDDWPDCEIKTTELESDTSK
jgi:hypothetical protein